MIRAPLYFGCWHGPGHFFWRPGMHRVRDIPSISAFERTPFGVAVDGRLLPRQHRAQGDAALTHHRDDWTALSIHDYTVDARGGSHSTFLMPGTLTFEGMLTAARHHFPSVVDRIGAVRLVGVHGTIGT